MLLLWLGRPVSDGIMMLYHSLMRLPVVIHHSLILLLPPLKQAMHELPISLLMVWIDGAAGSQVAGADLAEVAAGLGSDERS